MPTLSPHSKSRLSMSDDLLARLTAIAPILNSLPFNPEAECFYELMSGTLVWRDELPHVPPDQLCPMRFLFRYRTTLILSQPDPGLESFWHVATRLFPQWPGLHESRRSTSLAAFYKQKKAKWDRQLQRCLQEDDRLTDGETPT